jgi:hypothetical protein
MPSSQPGRTELPVLRLSVVQRGVYRNAAGAVKLAKTVEVLRWATHGQAGSEMNLAGKARQISDPVGLLRVSSYPALARGAHVRRCLTWDPLANGCDVQGDF